MRLPTYQQLSKEQDQVMFLPLDGSYLITGPPGTGKTVVALYRASRLGEADKVPLLLMYNRLLMMYTKAASDELALKGRINTFDSWFWSFYLRHYQRTPPMFDPDTYDWVQILSTINSSPPAQGSLPYLLVDEAQDLPKEFFLFAQLMSQNVTILADEHQGITKTQSTIEDILQQSGIALENVRELTRNHRNTREIAELVAHFYTGTPQGRPEPPIRSGGKPQLLKHVTRDETIDTIARYAGNNPTREIGVMLPSRETQDYFFDTLSRRPGLRVQKYIGGMGKQAPLVKFDEPGITVLHHKSAKGLEFDRVYLPELQDMDTGIDLPDLKMMLYMLTSRARDSLYLTYSGDVAPSVLRYFDSTLLEGM